MKIKCKVCKKEFRTFPCYVKTGRGIYCSMECRGKCKDFKAKIHTEETHKKIGDRQRGKKRSNVTGPKNYLWQGDEVKYRPLHAWVERHKGKPSKCEKCGIIKNDKHAMHWANKSGKYLRKLDDWIRLCAKCHKKYDVCMKH